MEPQQLSVIILLVINIASGAYFLGRLSGKVDSVDRRLTRVENKLNGKGVR